MNKELIKQEFIKMWVLWNPDKSDLNLRDNVYQVLPPLSESERDQYDFIRFFIPAADELFSKGKNKFYSFQSLFIDFYRQYLHFKDFIDTNGINKHVSSEIQDSWKKFTESIEIIATELEIDRPLLGHFS